MLRIFQSFILYLLLRGTLCAVETIMPSSEKLLIKQLIDKYEKAGKIGRPVKNSKDTVTLGYGLSLFQLLDLDEKNQVLTTNVWVKYTWVDQLLQWDPANYSNVREVRIPPRLIWTPDIALINYADERVEEIRDVMLLVDYTGRVFWSPPAIFKSNCRINIRNFPFDYQLCYLKFASLTQSSKQIDLQFLDNQTEVDIDQYTSSNEWAIIARPARRFVRLSDDCQRAVPDLTFFLYLKRNPAYFAYILVCPCILQSLLTTVIFWLPPHVSAKMLLSLNLFVAFLFLLKVLATSTPSASTVIPFLGFFFCLNMFLLSISTFLSTYIVNMHAYASKRQQVPQYFVKMVRLFSYILSVPPMEDEENMNPTLSEMKMEKLSNSDPSARLQSQDERYLKSPTTLLSGINPSEYTFSQFRRNLQEQILANSISGHNDSKSMFQLSSPHRVSEAVYLRGSKQDADTQKDTRGVTRSIQLTVHQLHLSLKSLMEKISKNDAAKKRAWRWRLVLMTIDRLFFWSYLILIIGVGCFLLIPMGPQYDIGELIDKHAQEYKTRTMETAAQCMADGSELFRDQL